MPCHPIRYIYVISSAAVLSFAVWSVRSVRLPLARGGWVVTMVMSLVPQPFMKRSSPFHHFAFVTHLSSSGSAITTLLVSKGLWVRPAEATASNALRCSQMQSILFVSRLPIGHYGFLSHTMWESRVPCRATGLADETLRFRMFYSMLSHPAYRRGSPDDT